MSATEITRDAGPPVTTATVPAVTAATVPAVTTATVVEAWWPLALSWLLMTIEQLLVAAVIPRLPDPGLNLAAYGVVFSIALVIEAPIIMLLAASTELSRDRASYRALRRFTHRAGFTLTVLHLLLAVTPLYDVVVGRVLGVPPDLAEHARWGVLLMLPWSWSIGWRRMGQGVLIRFGRSRAVGRATAVRLGANAVILGAAWLDGTMQGVVVGAVSLSAGVLAEAIYVHVLVRRVATEHLQHDDPEHPPLRGRAFFAFYVPLAMMPFVALVLQPIGTAALTRMPAAVASLAVWPVINGLLLVLQSPGMALNEVVVALLDRPGARAALWRFVVVLAIALTIVLAILSFTPLAQLWFGSVSGLSPSLTALAAGSLGAAVVVPGSRALQSWYQGKLVRQRRTRGISEAVLVFAVSYVVVLAIGARYELAPGIVIALVAVSIARLLETGWLALRSSTAG